MLYCDVVRLNSLITSHLSSSLITHLLSTPPPLIYHYHDPYISLSSLIYNHHIISSIYIAYKKVNFLRQRRKYQRLFDATGNDYISYPACVDNCACNDDSDGDRDETDDGDRDAYNLK